MTLKLFKSPQLPRPPAEYDTEYMSQLIRAVDLYFTQLDNGKRTNRITESAYGEFWSETDQTSAGTTSENIFTLEEIEYSNLITVQSNTQITFEQPGYYFLTTHAHFANTGTAVQDIDIWLKKSGTNLPDTRTRMTVLARKSVGVPAYIATTNTHLLRIDDITQYIQIAWWTDGTSVQAEYIAAGTSPTRPRIPSIDVEVIFVSAL